MSGSQDNIDKRTRRHYSPSASLRNVESHKLIPTLLALAFFNALLAGVALGISFWALSYADKARMEARIEQVKVEGMARGLVSKGIPINKHFEGEDP